MLNYGRFFVDVQPEKLTIKQGNTAELALTVLVVEHSHVQGFISMLQEAQKDMNARFAVQESSDMPLYIKRMCDTEFKELASDVNAYSVDIVANKWGIPENVIEKLLELLP